LAPATACSLDDLTGVFFRAPLAAGVFGNLKVDHLGGK